MNMKNFFALAFCCFTFFTSVGQDSTRLDSKQGFKIHFLMGGAFLKNIDAQYLAPSSPLVFVEGGIEVGQRFNVELNVQRVLGSVDTVNLNFTKIQIGVNNKSELNKDLSLVLRIGGGFIMANKDYKISEDLRSLDVNFLRIGGGLEQKISKFVVMTFNLGYDISSNALFNGLGISEGVKVGLPHKEGEDVSYF